MTRADFIIVGAGFAGLSAAVRLTQSGARVIVFESRGRLGGRATAFADRDTGALVDNGQHVLLGCYRETLAFLKTVGADANLSRQPALRVTMVDEKGKRSRLECPDLPSPLHLAAGVLEWDALGWRDRLSILRMAGPLRAARRALQPGATRIAASPGETVENWLIRNGQTRRLRDMLWEPLALAALNQRIERAAAPPFARVLAEMFGPDPAAAAILLPNTPLHLMYAEPAREYIEAHGGAVRTGVPANVELRGGRVAAVHANGAQLQAARVIVAVPWHALDGTIAGDRAPLQSTLAAAAATESSPIVSVHLWFDRPVLDEPFIGLPGRTLQWAFDTRAVSGSSEPSVSMVSSGASDTLRRPNSDLIATAARELASALAEAARARLTRATVVREPRATFSVAPGAPARPQTTTAVDGLLLAGDWIDTGLPATIESAVRSGHSAAAAALQS